MRNIPHYNNQLVTINFYPQSIVCSIINKSHKAAPFILRAYERFDLNNLELEQLILFNPTTISRSLHNFLKKHNGLNAFVACSIRGPLLFEKYITLAKQSPTAADFTVPELKRLTWDYRYVYPTDHGQSVFYVAGLPRELIMQYTLLAINAQLRMISLIPEQMALLHVYQYQRGKTFRRTQLAVDMLQHHNITDYLCTPDTLGRILYIPHSLSVDRSHNIGPLLAACGLFISEGMHS